jgi:putative oxidoreductase
MERFLGRFSEIFYTLMRVIFGLLFACHGAQKLFGVFGFSMPKLPPLLLAAGLIEFVGGLLIAVGLLGGTIAFIAAGEMACAYFMGHAPHGFWPIVNKGELAVLYCFAFLYMASRGSGRFSIDGLIKGSKRSAA